MDKTFWPIFRNVLTNGGKNEDEDEKLWENGLEFWIFYENLWKKHFQSFFKTFFTNWGKNEDEDEKI